MFIKLMLCVNSHFFFLEIKQRNVIYTKELFYTLYADVY